MNYFVYNGVSSLDMGLRIESKNVFSAPEYDVTFQSIPGRNGDLILPNGRYPNVQVTYSCLLYTSPVHCSPARHQSDRAGATAFTGGNAGGGNPGFRHRFRTAPAGSHHCADGGADLPDPYRQSAPHPGRGFAAGYGTGPGLSLIHIFMDKIAEKCKTNRPAPKAEPKGRSVGDLYERLNLLKH